MRIFPYSNVATHLSSSLRPLLTWALRLRLRHSKAQIGDERPALWFYFQRQGFATMCLAYLIGPIPPLPVSALLMYAREEKTGGYRSHLLDE